MVNASHSRIMFGRGGKVDEAGGYVAESDPLQNQAATQKLLQKMNNYNRNEGHYRGLKPRGMGKDEDASAVLTLDEWERKRTIGSSSLRQETPNVNQDEDLARQLQNQFDLNFVYILVMAVASPRGSIF
ncbi:hypothetical protein Tco_1502696 [Tanacetum coccineum]